MPVIHDWTPAITSNTAADSSAKTFPVSASEAWQPIGIWVKLVTTSTVGNRQLVVQFQDTAQTPAIVGQVRAGAVQAASTTRYYFFAVGMQDLTSMRDTDYLCTPMPPLTLLPGYAIKVWDKAAVAPAADDMEVTLHYEYRSI